jgi:hypothetical protein
MKTLVNRDSSKKQIRENLILFLIFPIAALVRGFRNYRSKIFLNLIWAFVAFHGFTLVITDEGMDSARYAEKLKLINSLNPSWDNFVATLLTSDNVDIIEPVLTYTIGLFTANERILFLCFGLVFGFFYSRNIGYLIKNSTIKKTNYFLIAIFALTIPFWEINGFRMWTAAHIFFFASVRIIDDKISIKNLALLALVPAMHFSFVLPIAFLIAFKFLGNRPVVYYVSFLLTFLISEIDLAVVREIVIAYTPDFLDKRVKGYTLEGQMETLEEKKQNVAFYIKYQGLVFKAGLFLLLTYLVILNKKLKRISPKAYNYLSFSLFFLSIANLLSLIPSGGRFLSIANLFALTTFLIFWGAKHFQVKPILLEKITFFSFFVFGFISIWRGFQTISVMLVIGNPIFALVSNLETSLSQVVKLEFL